MNSNINNITELFKNGGLFLALMEIKIIALTSLEVLPRILRWLLFSFIVIMFSKILIQIFGKKWKYQLRVR